MGESGLGMTLVNFIAAYFFLTTVSVIIAVAANLFLSFIIAEDAFYRGSDHAVAWGVFCFFISWLAVFAYYLTTHRHLLVGHDSNDAFCPRPTRQDMKNQKIHLKIILWIFGITAGAVALTVGAAVFLAVMITA